MVVTVGSQRNSVAAAETVLVVLARKVYGDRAVVRHRDNQWWVDPRDPGRPTYAGVVADSVEGLVVKLRAALQATKPARPAAKGDAVVKSEGNSAYLNTKDAAAFLGVHTSTVLNWYGQGKLRGERRQGKRGLPALWVDPDSLEGLKRRMEAGEVRVGRGGRPPGNGAAPAATAGAAVMSADEAAKRLGVHKTTVGDWVRAKRLRGRRVGRALEIDAASVEKAVARLANGGFRRGAAGHPRVGRKKAAGKIKRGPVTSLAGPGASLHIAADQWRAVAALQKRLVATGNPLMQAAAANPHELARTALRIGLDAIGKDV